MVKKLNLNILKKTILTIKFLFFALFIGNAQNYVLQKNISVDAKKIEVDKFGNIYSIEEYKITKYDSKGKLLFLFDDFGNGEISTLDVSNPLKPLVFYKDLKIVYVLDQKLSLVKWFNFIENNLEFVSTISTSKGSNYIVFDEIDNNLKKIDKSFNLLYESESFLNLFEVENKVFKITEENNSIYVLDKEGIKLFDSFLNYIKTIPLNNIKDFQVFENEIIYLDNNKLYSYNTTSLQYKEMSIPKSKDILEIKLIKNTLIVLIEGSLLLYSF